MKKKILVLVGILALVAALAAPMAALADQGTTQIGGTVGASLVFQAPGPINFGTFKLGVNGPVSGTPGSVETNNPTGCTVTVISNRYGGQMQPSNAELSPLLAPLMVMTGVWTVPQPVTSVTALVCDSTSYPTSDDIPLSATQNIDPGDQIGNYTLILTYSASVNP